MAYFLTDYQEVTKQAIYKEWANGAKVVMPVLATGAGKTVLAGRIAHEFAGHGCVMAHRSELVGQLSVALAREGLRHDIIAPKSVVRDIVQSHMLETGRSYHDPRAKWKVASTNTLLRRDLPNAWLNSVGLVIGDEGHHYLRDNSFGRALQMFPNARAMLPTATPSRADGKGLGSHADGLVDALVEGPSMRWLIDNGYLTGYQIRAPHPSDLNLDGIAVSPATGDYNLDQVRKRVKASTRIVGDVVDSYKQFAMGKLGITFAVDVEHATQIATAYNAAGVPAAVVHADSSEHERVATMRAFKARKLWQLVNVDLFGEGVDVPAVEVVTMVRPTASFGLYCQQFGRALRLLVDPVLRAGWHLLGSTQRLEHIASSSKPIALVIDHVGNVIKHGGPPDWPRAPWSLDARLRSTRATDGIALRACTNPTCLQPYERVLPVCPWCNTAPPPPADRSKPEYVDGDIVLYDDELLARLFGERARVDGECYIPHNATPVVANSIRKNHRSRQEAQAALRTTMGLVMPPTRDERVNNRMFYRDFGIDTLTAQTLGAGDAAALQDRIARKLRGEIP